MSFTSTKLELNVAEPILFLRGEASAASGCFLRGDLMLQLKKPTRFKKIELTFKGIAETRIPEGIILNGTKMCESQEIISHTWTFLAPPTEVESQTLISELALSKFSQHEKQQKKPQNSHLIPAGVYTFPFELLLPGNLPETINVEFSTLKYQLMATAVRTGVFPNIHVKNVIEIVRTLPDPEIDLGIAIARDVDGIFGYEMTIPETAYTLGSLIPIDLQIYPYQKKFKLYSIQAEIVEKALYKAGGQKFSAERTVAEVKVEEFEQTRLIDQLDDDNIGNVSYHKTLVIELPKRSRPLNYTCETPLLSISHQVRIQFSIPSMTRLDKRMIVRSTTPIRLLSCRCVDTHLTLPKYEDDSCFCPYDPIYQRAARLVLGGLNSETPPPPYEFRPQLEQVSSTTQPSTSDLRSESIEVEMIEEEEVNNHHDRDSTSLGDFVFINHPEVSSTTPLISCN